MSIKIGKNESTEIKIKNTARILFYEKGFESTSTRDIALKAGINLALLNYYFRSKQKLFEQIMLETILPFFHNVTFIFNDSTTSLKRKIELIVDKYINFIIKEPNVPIFILSELRKNYNSIFEHLPIKKIILESYFVEQYKELFEKGKIKEPNILHFMLNLMAMIIFPVLANPIIKKTVELNENQYIKFLKERKKKIPIWIENMFFTV